MSESVKCTGCNKLPNEVFAMIAMPVPGIAICNECIQVCAEIVGEKWALTSHHMANFKRPADNS